MKTLCFSFTPTSPKTTQGQKSDFFHDGRFQLLRRGLQCNPGQANNDALSAFYYDKGWPSSMTTQVTGHLACHENTYWNIPLSGLRFSGISSAYDSALLPCPTFERHVGRGYTWHNGECYFGDNKISITVTCLPTPRTICVSMNIKEGDDYDLLRKEFLRVQREVELRIVQTRATLRLIGSFRDDPKNTGRIERYVNDLLASIGTF